MKNSKKIILTVTFILSALLFFNEKSYSDFFFMAHMATPLPGLSITYETFHSDLEPAGEWIPVSRAEIIPDNEEEIEAGYVDNDVDVQYIWKPNVEYVNADWVPYSDGNWVYTDVGWTWESDYDWGWAPYHYGRWWHSPAYGWVWSAGLTWAPAWVSFTYTDSYVGWCPIEPWHHWRWENNCIVSEPTLFVGNSVVNNHWNFVDKNNFTIPIRNGNFVNVNNNSEIINHFNSTAGNRGFDSRGPSVRNIESTTNTRITPKQLNFTSDRSAAGMNGNNLAMFKNKAIQNDNIKENSKNNLSGQNSGLIAANNTNRNNANNNFTAPYLTRNSINSGMSINRQNINSSKLDNAQKICKNNSNLNSSQMQNNNRSNINSDKKTIQNRNRTNNQTNRNSVNNNKTKGKLSNDNGYRSNNKTNRTYKSNQSGKNTRQNVSPPSGNKNNNGNTFGPKTNQPGRNNRQNVNPPQRNNNRQNGNPPNRSNNNRNTGNNGNKKQK